MADLELQVNGQSYAGWETVRVTRGIEAVAGSFELSVSDRWADQREPWPIVEEDECTVTLAGEQVISGYVDRRRISYSAEEHSLTVSGRDKTGSLVDCSAVLKSWEFASLPLKLLAQRVCEPFGIGVALAAGLSPSVSLTTGKGGTVSGGGGAGKLGLPKPLAKFSVSPGESAFEVLDRACRFAGVLPVSDGVGGLLLTRAGSSRAMTALIEGENILAASADYDAAGRYAKYIVSAQHQGTDAWFGSSAAAVLGSAADSTVRRTERVLYVRPETSMTPESAKTRAAWEAKVRAARGDAVTITVVGWQQADGTLWPINALVHLRSPLLGMDAELLITQAVHSLDESGATTQLTLRRADAFLPEPTIGQPSGLWKEIARGA